METYLDRIKLLKNEQKLTNEQLAERSGIPLRRHRIIDVVFEGVECIVDVGLGQSGPRIPLVLAEGLIQEQFGGDGMAYAKCYYEAIAGLPDEGSFDIVGHFDAVAKTVEQNPFVDVESKAYLDCAFEALHALMGKIPFFEVNTGAMSRGYRTQPYPTLSILKEMHRVGAKLLISSDCHDRRFLTHGFDTAAALMREAGYRETYILTKNGFTPIPLEA